MMLVHTSIQKLRTNAWPWPPLDASSSMLGWFSLLCGPHWALCRSVAGELGCQAGRTPFHSDDCLDHTTLFLTFFHLWTMPCF